MANFNIPQVNLLAFKQAQVLTNIDHKNPTVPYVCIPVPVNEIKLQGNRATVRMTMNNLRSPEKVLAGINRKRQQNGEDPMTMDDLHSHTLDVSFSDDFVLSWIKAYKDALVKKTLEAQSPDYADKIKDGNPEDTNSDLFKAIRRYMQPKLANVYPFRSQQTQQSAYPQQFAQASGATAYVAPAEGEDAFDAAAYADPNSNLPF